MTPVVLVRRAIRETGGRAGLQASVLGGYNRRLEKAVQFLKGGFSYRAKKELGYLHEVWHKSFNEHQITDAHDYEKHRQYVYRNPVKRGLSPTPEEYAYSSANPRFEMDTMPQWLKPGLKASIIEAS